MNRTILLDNLPGCDVRTALAAALSDARSNPGTTIIVPPGRYVVTSELARKTQQDVMAGLYGENPESTMFDPLFAFTEGITLEGHEHTVLQAYGVSFLIDGFMEPICIRGSKHVSVEGLAIDHVRKPYSRGVIEQWKVEEKSAHRGSFVVRFADEFPVDENTIMPRYCAFDYATNRFNLDIHVMQRTYLGEQRFLFHADHMPERNLLGQEYYVWHSFHFRPCILIEGSSDVTLRDVSIHSQPGMGVVGHRSQDILLDRLAVSPSFGDHMSTNTDATHFTSCKGYLKFSNCLFEGQGDDATNVHTFYHDISRLSETVYCGRVSVRTHSLSMDYPDKGDLMELVDRRTLLKRGEYRIISVTLSGSDCSYVAEVDGALPNDVEERCWMANVTQMPRLLFSRCVARNHWARSVLIKTRNAIVEHCVFTGSVLCAIHIAAEGSWHEGVTCENIIVRHNRFVDCGIGGHADTGGVKVEISAEEAEGTPQKNIVIEHNIFDLRDVACAVHISNAMDVRIEDNTFLGRVKPVEILHSLDVVVVNKHQEYCEGYLSLSDTADP